MRRDYVFISLGNHSVAPKGAISPLTPLQPSQNPNGSAPCEETACPGQTRIPNLRTPDMSALTRYTATKIARTTYSLCADMALRQARKKATETDPPPLIRDSSRLYSFQNIIVEAGLPSSPRMTFPLSSTPKSCMI